MEWEDDSLPDLPTSPHSMMSQLARINITADPDSFSYMFTHFTDDVEISSIIDYYEPSGQLLFNYQAAKLEIKGTSSARYEMKSFGLIFDQPLDNSNAQILNPYHVNSGHQLDQLASIRLRNSGNDFGRTMLKDMAYSALAAHAGLNFELMYGAPVQVFVNGDYYGLLNLRTENNIEALSLMLNIPKQELSLFQMDDGELEFDEGAHTAADEFLLALEEEDLEVLDRMVNRQSFIDYLIFQDYIGNDDWPDANCRAHIGSDGMMRFFLFDLDYAAYRTQNPRLPEMEYLEDDLSEVYRIFLNGDPTFAVDLAKRQAELYDIFTPGLFNSIVDRKAALIENDISYLISKYGKPASILHWQLELAELKREFERQDHFIRKKYGL